MSAVSSPFQAHSGMHSEKSAISLVEAVPIQPRLARNRFQVRNSVRPMHLFGHNVDHDCCSNSPVKRSGTPNQLLGVQLHTMAMSGLSRVRTELVPLLVIPS